MKKRDTQEEEEGEEERITGVYCTGKRLVVLRWKGKCAKRNIDWVDARGMCEGKVETEEMREAIREEITDLGCSEKLAGDTARLST